jgi:hypothetical protein
MVDSWHSPIKRFESQNRIDIVKTMNNWMNEGDGSEIG